MAAITDWWRYAFNSLSTWFRSSQRRPVPTNETQTMVVRDPGNVWVDNVDYASLELRLAASQRVGLRELLTGQSPDVVVVPPPELPKPQKQSSPAVSLATRKKRLRKLRGR